MAEAALLAQRAETNLLRAAECWASASGGSFRRAGGLVVSTTPADLRSFNQTFITAPTVTQEDLARAIEGYGGSRFRIRTLATVAASMDSVMESAGLASAGGLPSMALENHQGQARESGLDIRPVRDEGSLAHHVSIVASAFGWTSGELGRVFAPVLLADAAWQAWVGYRSGTPVATAQLVVHERVAGLYYVGTHESHRGYGYGEALTRHAVSEGFARGCDIATLQASPLGRPVYERIGFRVVGEYLTFVPGDEV